ncbi:MAG: hypothetical protein V3V67_07905 [Myxococcota bacterium]
MRRLLVYAGLVLAVIVVFALARVLWVTLLSAAVAAVVALAVNRWLGREAPAQEPGAEERTAGAEAEWISGLGSLVELNIAIREHALPQEVTATLESNIDVLRRLLPELNDQYVGSELTWIVNRMAVDYLPRIVHPFIQLRPPGRAEHQQELLESLGGLEAELENIEGLVRDQNVGDFRAKAAFLRTRFLDGSLG